MKRMLGLLGFLILLCPSAWSADDLMSRQMVDQAREWTQKGRDDLASPVWRKLLSVEPGHPEALVKLGLIEFRSGNVKEAQSLYQRASRLNPSPKGLSALSKVLYPVEEILPTPKISTQSVPAVLPVVPPKPIEPIKKEATVKEREPVQKPIASVKALEVIREPKSQTGNWEDRRLSLEKAVQNHPGDARHLLALASHLAQRESTRREAIRQLEALNATNLRSSEIKKPWKQALLAITPQQGDQVLFKSYLTRHPTSTSVLRRLNNLEGKETVISTRKTGIDTSNKTELKASPSASQTVNPACNKEPCK